MGLCSATLLLPLQVGSVCCIQQTKPDSKTGARFQRTEQPHDCLTPGMSAGRPTAGNFMLATNGELCDMHFLG
ncbi:hypothetical protein F4860DRAFT_477993 [Xylaria cubensis]|nr:hypothetical protein F4860DRAFT_477993 [Xylaria cubensis]